MNRGSRERAAWVALTGVLATSLTWMAVLCAALVARSCATCPPAILVVARALGRALAALAQGGVPVLAPLVAATLAAALIGGLLRGAPPRAKGARHER